jgi:hypothetical protein
MPVWVSEAFISGYDKVLNGRVRSWDEAFGPTGLERKNLENLRRNRKLKYDVFVRVMELKGGSEKFPTDDFLFETIGDEFGIKKTLANRLYYEVKNTLPEDK